MTAGSDEHGIYSDPAGGFLIGDGPLLDLRQSVLNRGGEIISRCLSIETNAPDGAPGWAQIDETSRADSHRWGGIAAAWTSETQVAPSGRMALALGKLQYHTLAVNVAMSNESLTDAPALGALLRRVLSAEGIFKLESAILMGTGAGQPVGVANSAATITVDAEDEQTVATPLTWPNVAAMRARLAPECVAGATWIVNPELLEHVADLDGPAGALDFSGPRPRILGLPVIESEAAAAVGQRGDIVLCDFGQYLLVSRPQSFAVSAHVRFVNDETVMRFSLRIDGSPLWKSPVQLANGSTTVSPFIVLAARPAEEV